MSENKTRRMSGLPIAIEALGDAIAALHTAREYTSSYTNATSARPGARIEGAEEIQERYAVAIRSLGQHLLGKIESLYEPEERDFVFRGHEPVHATWTVRARSAEEAKEKFERTAPPGATWYAMDDGVAVSGGEEADR